MTRSRLIAAIAVLIAGGVLTSAYLITRPNTVPDKLAEWLPGGCSQDDKPAGDVRDFFGFSNRTALSVVRVIYVHCDDEHLGPETAYVRFASRRDMLRALSTKRHLRQRFFLRNQKLCVLEDEVFDGHAMEPGQFRDSCSRLDGRVQVLH